LKIPFSWETLHILESLEGIPVEVVMQSQTLPLPDATQVDQSAHFAIMFPAHKPSPDTDPEADDVQDDAPEVFFAPDAEPQEPLANHYTLKLTAMPDSSTSAGELKYKAVERIVAKHFGMKVPEIRVHLSTLPLVILDKANLEFALQTKAKLEEKGASCEVRECGIQHAEVPTPETTPEPVTEGTVEALAETLHCMEFTAGNTQCPQAAKWRTNPDAIKDGHSDGVWCEEHKQDADVPIAEARLVVGEASGLYAASGLAEALEAPSVEQPALFPDAPPPPTLAELAERDKAWEGEPEDHRAEALGV
jgi:hypothetical protein